MAQIGIMWPMQNLVKVSRQGCGEKYTGWGVCVGSGACRRCCQSDSGYIWDPEKEVGENVLPKFGALSYSFT